MEESVRPFTGPQVVALAAVVLGIVCMAVVAGAAVLVGPWQRVRLVEAEAALKRDLAAAGFTADEIERVVRATAGHAGQRA